MVFSGTVQSDFLKYLPTALDEKEKLIDYSVADFASIRDALLKYSRAVFPLDYNNFSESDFGVFLIELMAAVGHIQSIKSDYLANENFLRTARNRSSVKKLLELIGVRMKGPISAAANAEMTFTTTLEDVSAVTISAENRNFVITSPEDGAPLSYTLYKINQDGTVDLKQSSVNLDFTVSSQDNDFTISSLVLLEGALVVETGQFDNVETVKTISLSQFPYVEKSCQIFIEGSQSTEGIYTEEENIYYASGSNDKIFQVLTDESNRATILFGDSTLGQSPAPGDTYTITYRIGGGTRGNIAARVLSIPVSIEATNGSATETIQATMENSTQATGGADAETITKAKRYAPLIFRRQDRVVTVADYKSFVNTFISNYGSTGKANAVVRRAYSSANIIDLFVLEKASNTQLKKATPAYKTQLLEALQEKKMLTDEPVVVDGLIRTIDVILTITCDKIFKRDEALIRGKARDKVLEYFNIDNTDFEEPFDPQDLAKSVLSIPEIRFCVVDNIQSPIRVNFNEIIQLNNFTVNINFI